MDIIKRIQDFDEELSLTYQATERINLYIVGGSALYLHGLLKRATYDVDAFLKPTYKQNIESIMNKYDINTRVQQVYEEHFPYDFASRAVKVEIETRMLNVYKISIEDLVISKLGSPRPKDLKDISLPEVVEQINWQLLDELFHDKIGDLLNERIQREFIETYNNYVKDHKKWENGHINHF